jgi:hypothetical protein
MSTIMVLELFAVCTPTVVAQGKLNVDDLVGNWTVSFMEYNATFNLEKFDKEANQGRFTSEGSLGPIFGGPNPLNATKWRVEGFQLVFFHISRRGDDQVILAGDVEFQDATRFKLTLKRGYWVAANQRLRNKIVDFKR